MIHRLTSLILKELIQFSRDPVLLVFSILAPALQIIMLGNAISVDIQDIPVAVIDEDRSVLSREIITALDNTSELNVVSFPTSIEEARDQMDRGDILGVAIMPPNFMVDMSAPGSAPQMQVILDGASSIVAGRALSAAQGAITSLVAEAVVVAGAPQQSSIHILTDSLFNSTLDFRPDSITSQLALITFQITTMIAVMGIVREREIGTIEMLSITPLRRLELIAGKAITPLFIGLIDFVMIFIVTQVFFDIPMRGSFWLLFAITALYLFCEIGYALMISTITRSQQQAVTLVFVWVMIALTMSGYLVPISTLPEVLQWASWGIPLRHYLGVVRSVMLKGAEFNAIIQNVVALFAIMIAMIFLTTRTLSRAIE